jgi:preprotein translocase subunit SecA
VSGTAGVARPGTQAQAGARAGQAGAAGAGGAGGAGGGVAGVAAGGAAAGQQARPGYTPSGAKIGRNDACWCGSGMKYKKCHGR